MKRDGKYVSSNYYGWKPYDSASINLTKEQAKDKVEELLREGVAINRLKAFPNDTQSEV